MAFANGLGLTFDICTIQRCGRAAISIAVPEAS